MRTIIKSHLQWSLELPFAQIAAAIFASTLIVNEDESWNTSWKRKRIIPSNLSLQIVTFAS